MRRATFLLCALGLLLPAAAAQAQAPAPFYAELTDGLRYKGLAVASAPGRSPSFSVLVMRGSLVVAGRTTGRGVARLTFDPMPGDTVLIGNVGRPEVAARYVWDGLPTITRACVGARVLAGTADGITMERAGTFTFAPGRYSPRTEQAGRLSPQGSDGFIARLAAPIRTGALVYAVGSTSVPNLFVRAAVEGRASASCSAPSGRIQPIGSASRRAVLARGLTVRIRSGQAGRAVVRLYAVQAARSGRRAKRTLVATARRTLARGGTSRVRLRVTRRGRSAARRARRLEVRATLVDVTGKGAALPRRSVRLRR